MMRAREQTSLRTSRHAWLFLMEIVLAIVLFLVSFAVILTLFAKAHEEKEQAKALSMATEEFTDLSAMIRSADSQEELISLLKQDYPDASFAGTAEGCDGTGFPGMMKTSSGKDYEFWAEFSFDARDNLTAKLSLHDRDSGKTVKSLTVQHFLRDEAWAEDNQETQ